MTPPCAPLMAGVRRKVERRLRCRGRKEGYAQAFGWHSSALGAALEGDGGAFEESVTKIVGRHAREAQRGKLRSEAGGLLCVSALALMRAGADEGLELKVESPYAPQSLLGG